MSTAADHLDGEATEATEIPDPEKATIKDLTAHCRAAEVWPENWTKIKAADKRTAFRRTFCPEASETFDPNDPLHLISEWVENLGQDEVTDAVRSLTEDVGMNYFKLGGVLLRVTSEGWYAEQGHDTMKEWVAAETDMKYGKARYLIRVYNRFNELEIPWEKLQGIGWTKAIELLDVINQENVGEWVDKAKHLSVRLLREEVANLTRGSSGDGAEGGDDPAAKPQQLNFRLYPEQMEVVNLALDKVGKEAGKENRGVCLEFMAAACLSGQFGIRDIELSETEPQTLDEVEAALLVLMQRAKKLAGDDFDAMDPVVKAMDATFPDAEIDVKV